MTNETTQPSPLQQQPVIAVRCEGWRRTGGAFTLGRSMWSQCENEATVIVMATQDGETKTFPACPVCWNESIERKIKIVSVKPICPR